MAGSALQFAHRYQPEGRVGGDFFTIMQISDTQAGVLATMVAALLVVLLIRLQLLNRALNASNRHLAEMADMQVTIAEAAIGLANASDVNSVARVAV